MIQLTMTVNVSAESLFYYPTGNYKILCLCIIRLPNEATSSSSAQQLANFTLLHYDKEDLPIGETRGLVALIPLW